MASTKGETTPQDIRSWDELTPKEVGKAADNCCQQTVGDRGCHKGSARGDKQATRTPEISKTIQLLTSNRLYKNLKEDFHNIDSLSVDDENHMMLKCLLRKKTKIIVKL